MKKYVIIIGIIFILFVVSIFVFISGFKKDQELTKSKMVEISENYETFNTKINEFAKAREELYKNLDGIYLEEMSKNYNDFNSLIAKYEQSIKDVENSSKNLKESCDVKFTDASINNKCTTFKANYEAANNYYITDIKSYNKTVSNYNNWVTENNYNYGKLNEGQLVVYKKYIDFDKDGEYFGKESSNEQ